MYTAIGTLVVAASNLEGTMRRAVLNMLGGQHWRRTDLVVEGYSAGQMNERCDRLARSMLAGGLQDDMLAWLKEVTEVQRTRNAVVHSTWASRVLVKGGDLRGPTALRARVTRADGLATEIRQYSAEELRAAAGRCTTVDLTGSLLIEELQVWSQHERDQGGADLSPWTRAGVDDTPAPRP